MQLTTQHFILALIMTISVQIAHAEETPPFTQDMFEFSGFATLGVAHSSEDRADFVNKRNLPQGAGNSHNWSFNSDSRLGMQLDATFNDRLSAVSTIPAG